MRMELVKAGQLKKLKTQITVNGQRMSITEHLICGNLVAKTALEDGLYVISKIFDEYQELIKVEPESFQGLSVPIENLELATSEPIEPNIIDTDEFKIRFGEFENIQDWFTICKDYNIYTMYK